MRLLYLFFIQPLEYLMDVLVYKLYNVYLAPVPALIGLSIIVNLLTAPLYRRAEQLQKKEREEQKAMERWLSHIKKTFSGDEKQMMTDRYYRLRGYLPLRQLLGSLPLLLQIPFFIAAYHYLSDLNILKAVPYGEIRDLAYPDALLVLGGRHFNLLPFVMTGINLLSAFFFSKDKSRREKLQAFLLPLIFLVLLYDSAAGLLIYWTCNNLISLGRSLAGVFPKRRRLMVAFFMALLPLHYIFLKVIALGYADWYVHDHGFFWLLIFLFLLVSFGDLLPLRTAAGTKKRSFIPILLALSLFFGVTLPVIVTASSPADFIDPYFGQNPWVYTGYSLLVFSGLFLLWGGIAVLVADEKGLAILGPVFAWLLANGILNVSFFGQSYGSLNSNLRYDGLVRSPLWLVLLNLALAAGVFAAVTRIWKKRQRLIVSASRLVCAVCIGIAVWGVVRVSGIAEATEKAEQKYAWEDLKETAVLDRQGKNVLFIMLDRAIGAYVPYILYEKPELAEKLDGFTFYPDTLSFGWKTAIGSPSLFGGYEYMPEAMNQRSDELLRIKHNEALSVLPVLFGKAGYAVNVYDPPMANYHNIPDLSIYDPYPYIGAHQMEGKFNDSPENMAGLLEQRKRYFVRYSVMRSAPLLLTEELYDGGNYMVLSSEVRDLSVSFMHYYRELQLMPQLTKITDSGTGGFVMLQNSITHEPSVLQMPDYVPAAVVDNTGYDMTKRRRADGPDLELGYTIYESHYAANMAALQLLGNYFDWMREQGVYDNTRIVIAADHGHPLGQMESMLMNGGEVDAMSFNPLLLYKDFDSRGFTVSDAFMTNADAPLLAISGLVEPVNPFTGKRMTDEPKRGVLHVAGTEDRHGMNEKEDRTQYDTSDRPWYAVHDSMLDEKNWSIWKQAGE
ncbi:MAG: YidC/Oxa1 family membrane protein insertase [Lachnospiraceae bacterium]|nr:YidC/Oxa1 family membrane protein insertase [Lachnospiraceae bacterium]